MQEKHLNKIAEAYGYKYANKINLVKGDEVIIYNNRSQPICEGIVESVMDAGIKVNTQWWYDLEYSFRKINL